MSKSGIADPRARFAVWRDHNEGDAPITVTSLSDEADVKLRLTLEEAGYLARRLEEITDG